MLTEFNLTDGSYSLGVLMTYKMARIYKLGFHFTADSLTYGFQNLNK